MTLPITDFASRTSHPKPSLSLSTSSQRSNAVTLIAASADVGILHYLETRTTAMTVAELAVVLHESPQELYQLAADGDIPHFRIRTGIRFCPAQIATWLRAHQCGKLQ